MSVKFNQEEKESKEKDNKKRKKTTMKMKMMKMKKKRKREDQVLYGIFDTFGRTNTDNSEDTQRLGGKLGSLGLPGKQLNLSL
ncbi:hypothetical protein M0804_002161 [Polistes exclamans]|nr:hypothetical protein M0804_002161 [Polistes exclamans]